MASSASPLSSACSPAADASASCPEPFAIGDVVRFRRGDISHVAIYVGNNQVVHRWSPCRAMDYRVRVDALDTIPATIPPENCTAELDARMLSEHSAVPRTGAEVVQRARGRLGEGGYDAFTNNCEHLVTWARYGVAVSLQARSHSGDVFTAALVGAAVGGFGGFLVCGAIAMLSKLPLLTASMGGSIAMSSAMMGEAEWDVGIQGTEGTVTTEDEAGEVEEIEGVGSKAGSVEAIEGVESEERRQVLVKKLAEDQLQCGICFDDLQQTRAVAFPCDHFTCGKCFDAFAPNDDGGYKSCPYCRLDIVSIATISGATKEEARGLMQQTKAGGADLQRRSHTHEM